MCDDYYLLESKRIAQIKLEQKQQVNESSNTHTDVRMYVWYISRQREGVYKRLLCNLKT